MTEFALNIVMFISTQLFVFMINYDFESRMSSIFQQTLQNQSENVYWFVKIQISSIKWKTFENSLNKD
jgi:hypothetical protein